MNWIDIEKNGLPEEPGEYLVYVKDGLSPEKSEENSMFDSDLSYVTSACFQKDDCLWEERNDVHYNANLSCINKHKTYYISHWAPMPEPPKN